MNFPRRWKTTAIYSAMILILGLTAFTYGLARLDGSEEAVNGVAGVVNSVEGAVNGVEEVETVNPEITITQGPDTNLPVPQKCVGDFPSPVQIEPLRGVGNYYSENLKAYLFHAGADYPQAEGAMIRATHGGKVTYAGADPILGQKVEIDCGENWRVVYGGIENLRVKTGDEIKENDIVGQVGYYSGADGISDRTQLHYEVWKGNEAQVQ
ncbi:M23 family metallopeptidase [Desulfitobacterium sp.]|uniref:murein hydrolase activator EnvC family protein n=1 Tax=Desulfitobacterium sp. TaxID=49981 RepID=UPI002B217DCC|nr:M23 family metallopeptidase [Desulfitobacterium sp.]MEA4902707.1 M23 family metallopeptidase [Desulfitobacterium sp.]